jgi:hypothetical protein
MKTPLFISLLALVFCSLFIQAKKAPIAKSKIQTVDTVITYSVEARAIIDQKCFGCHNPEAKNEKARKKLMWDELPKNAKAKQLKLMNDMLEVLAEGKMPPEKFLEFKPEAKLTETEITTLSTWAEANAKKLSK